MAISDVLVLGLRCHRLNPHIVASNFQANAVLSFDMPLALIDFLPQSWAHVGRFVVILDPGDTIR